MNKNLIISCLALLCIGTVSANAERSSRGVVTISESKPFLQKGHAMLGGSALFSMQQADNFSFAVLSNLNSKNYNLSVSPVFMVAVADDLAVGAVIIYKRTLFDIATAKIKLADTNADIKDYYALNQDYGGGIFCRKYLGLGSSGRFAFFVDGILSYTAGQGKIQNNQNGQVIGSYETSGTIGVNVNPGVAAHLTEHFALSAGIGLLGVNYSWVHQTHNQVTEGGRNGFSASYTFNLLALGVGAYYCF